MNGNWARTEHVRGKGSAANCMICGNKPHILEKGYCDGSHSFYICCPGCYNRHFKDKRKTGVDITVVAENVYAAIRDWNKINARPKIAFICKDRGTEYCHHTTHIEHARNFEQIAPNVWMEKEATHD
jgi:hypothetical protein